MIKLFEKVIKEHLAEHISEKDFPLSYLKFSTVTSGSGLNDKVIFMVFRNGTSSPSLCLKTVRNYGAREAILRNFNNLKTLNTLTLGSHYVRLFAQALYLYDDGENIFSVETVCLGKRIRLNKERLKIVVTDYSDFQKYLAQQDKNSMRDIKQLAEETAIKSGLNESDRHQLLKYIVRKLPTSITLPRIIQHGDCTSDNLLWSKNGLCIVDYDYVGNSDIPGFDLFGLLHRFDRVGLSSLCKEYFPAYFKKIGGKSLDGNYRGLFLLYHITEYVQSKPHNSKDISFTQIVSDFEHLYPATLFL